MATEKQITRAFALIAAVFVVSSTAFAQGPAERSAAFIIPQSRSAAVRGPAKIEIKEVSAGIVILEQAATTTLDIGLSNPSNSRIEAELIIPVPDGAVVKSFSYAGAATEPTAKLLPKSEAKSTFESIVAKMRDPAIAEFAGYNLIRTSVFPIEPRGEQKVRITYEHLLTADGGRVDYVLPRSESLDYKIPWNISVKIKSKNPVSTVYSPSHRIDVVRESESIVSARTTAESSAEPGPFMLSYLVQKQDVTASLFAYPDTRAGGGYFLLIAGLPAKISDSDRNAVKRELTLVLDRSGSMGGEKIEQVREAAMQIISALRDNDLFNIITYNDAVDVFSKEPVLKNADSAAKARQYISEITALGGTNIHDALTEALRQKPAAGYMPMVIFLTDGCPTVGITSESAIREAAKKGNAGNRRIFTFGVGYDVNAPLLDGIAADSRAATTYVLPKENVEVKVGQVFKRLAGPVLSDIALEIRDSSGAAAAGRVRDMLPSKLTDMFEGDQLVLLGKYSGDQPVKFALSGNFFGVKHTFEFAFSFDNATTRNSFVPRLWASRQIGVLCDAIRALGADSAAATPAGVANPKMKELTDEIVRLSIEFGILTEYTAFLALEGTNIGDRDGVRREANAKFQSRAVATRSGRGAVNQSANLSSQSGQTYSNRANAYYDENMNRVSVSKVQQIGDRAYFNRGNRWVDSSLLEKDSKPAKTIVVGTPEFIALAERLAASGRQGGVALGGDVLLVVDGETILVTDSTNSEPKK